MRVRKSTPGFSLVEVMMVGAILAVVLMMATMVWVNSLNLWEAEQSYAAVSAGLRSTAWAMSQELAAAVASGRESLDPPVAGLSIVPEPNVAVVFQKPLVSDETQWSGLITIRHRNEDVDGNLKLDEGEDVDGNGVADRVVERLEDLNGDGNFEGPGETLVLGRDIDVMAVELVGSQLQVTLTGRAMGSRKKQDIGYSQDFRVRLLP